MNARRADTPRIEFLENTFGNSKGDVVKVIQENDTEINYYDGFRRWCYVLKSEAGELYRYIPKGERVIRRRPKAPRATGSSGQEVRKDEYLGT